MAKGGSSGSGMPSTPLERFGRLSHNRWSTIGSQGRNRAVQSKEEIYERLAGVLVDLFEIDRAKITLDADLYRDLEIDSIDTIDLVLQLKTITGRKIQPDQFRHVRSVGDAVNAIHNLIAGQSAVA
jgi:acyl carrier protein